jgi:protein-disulfide isomerase
VQAVDFETTPRRVPSQASARPSDVSIVEFYDLQCPYCAQYARTTYLQLRREMVDAGLIDYEFRHFPLQRIHPFSFKAGQAVECAGEEGKYMEMRERLFANQETLGEAQLPGHARAIGLDPARFRECMEDRTAARVREDENEGKRLGVKATPTFFVGRRQSNGRVKLVRRIEGAVSLETLRSTVKEVTQEPQQRLRGLPRDSGDRR